MKILKKGVESENASVFVVYDNDDNLVTLGKYISYKIQRSLYFYYISHYREIDWRDFVTFIRKDKDLRQTLRLIIENRFYNVNKSTFDFAVNACDIKFFSSEEQDEDNFNCSELFSEDETIILMKVLMIKQQSIYYLRLRQEGFNETWDGFANRLNTDKKLSNDLYLSYKYFLIKIRFDAEWDEIDTGGFLDEKIKKYVM